MVKNRPGGPAPIETPAEILARYMAAGDPPWTQDRLAEAVGKTQPRISQLLSGDGCASPDLADAIERVTGMPAIIWKEEAALRRARAELKKWDRPAEAPPLDSNEEGVEA